MNASHGHVSTRSDGIVYPCGGPAHCNHCWEELQNLLPEQRRNWLKWNHWSEKDYDKTERFFEYPIGSGQE